MFSPLFLHYFSIIYTISTYSCTLRSSQTFIALTNISQEKESSINAVNSSLFSPLLSLYFFYLLIFMHHLSHLHASYPSSSCTISLISCTISLIFMHHLSHLNEPSPSSSCTISLIFMHYLTHLHTLSLSSSCIISLIFMHHLPHFMHHIPYLHAPSFSASCIISLIFIHHLSHLHASSPSSSCTISLISCTIFLIFIQHFTFIYVPSPSSSCTISSEYISLTNKAMNTSINPSQENIFRIQECNDFGVVLVPL